MGIKFNNKEGFSVAFNEVKDKGAQNYEMYTESIRHLKDIGRVSGLKIIEAMGRVELLGLWKLGASHSDGKPYGSLNQWAQEEFGYAKSSVSEMKKVLKVCCDPETCRPLECFEGFTYTQLLRIANNNELLTLIKNGNMPEGISLNSTGTELSRWKPAKVESKEKKSDTDEQQGQKENKPETDNDSSSKSNTESQQKAQPETFNVSRETLEHWYNYISEANNRLAEYVDNNVNVLSETDNELLSDISGTFAVITGELSAIVGVPF